MVQDSKLTFETEYKRLNRDIYRPANIHKYSGDFNELTDFEKGGALFEKSKDSLEGGINASGLTNHEIEAPAEDMLASEQ